MVLAGTHLKFQVLDVCKSVGSNLNFTNGKKEFLTF